MGIVDRVDAKQRSAILDDLGCTELSLQEDIRRLRLWIKGQPHLPPSASQESDSFLQTFLLGCKGKLEKTKEKLDNYYTSRKELAHLLCPLDPLDSAVVATYRRTLIGALPKPTPEGHRVMMFSLVETDPDELEVVGVLKRIFMISELRAREDDAIAGEWAVLDAKNLTLAHVMKVPPRIIKEFIDYVQFAAPVRIKGAIFINAPSFLENALNLVIKPLLPKKLANRIFIYADNGKSLLNHYPKEMLPKDYGGESHSLQVLSEAWIEECTSKRDWFLGPLAEISDEQKRLGRNASEFLQGSFRQLLID